MEFCEIDKSKAGIKLIGRIPLGKKYLTIGNRTPVASMVSTLVDAASGSKRKENELLNFKKDYRVN